VINDEKEKKIIIPSAEREEGAKEKRERDKKKK